ncbi:lipolytic enzyme [Rhodopseudomonas palustris]|uniref:Lipolytic enzyme n=2 Tax=Nitrobacteraceae TaxID=41294 RepID=A0A0D7F616_RHOPL|nr:lipolytic enzyme [Rhodopseudomonas palustris]
MAAVLWASLVAGIWAGVPASAEEAQNCDVPAYLIATDSSLGKVAAALKAGSKLDILVVGSRSSSIAAAAGAAYPGRLQSELRARLPGATIDVTVDLQPRTTARQMVAGLGKLVAERKPTLVIWQTGTYDAIRSIDPDDFHAAVDEGVAAVRKAGADVVLLNLQYSPRTETMIAPSPYLDAMRLVAQQYNVPLFDRFAIMRHWNETGAFDLFNTSPGIGLALRVHACLARALATLVIDAAHVNLSELRIQR